MGNWAVKNNEVIVDEQGECIAMWATDCGDEITPENLKLIAAAPEMLEALKEIVAYENRCRAKGDPAIADTWLNLCKKAIKKATE